MLCFFRFRCFLPPSLRIAVLRTKIRNQYPADGKHNVLLASLCQRTTLEDTALTTTLLDVDEKGEWHKVRRRHMLDSCVCIVPYIPLRYTSQHSFSQTLACVRCKFRPVPSRTFLYLSGVFKLRHELKVWHLHASACMIS